MHARIESTQPRSGPTARIVAALALIAAVIVIGIMVTGSLGGSGERTSGKTTSGNGGASSKPAHDYYVLESGDTLGAVAHKFGISVGKLTELNPNLDSQALPPQGCVDLVTDGCKQLAGG